MNEIITMRRDVLVDRIDEFLEKGPAHVFIMDLIPSGEESVFSIYPESEFLSDQTFHTFLDDIQLVKPKEGEIGVTRENAEQMLNFIFKVRNRKLHRDKRLIIACKTGLTVSGAVAQWAMDWLMDGNEQEFNKLNPDIKPNEFLQYDLYLHPLI